MAGGLGQDRRVRGPSPAPRTAAAAVEDGQLDPTLVRESRQPFLGAEDLPLRRQVAAVLARVGVADHDLEPAASLLHERGEAGLVEERLDDRRRLAEVADRLEEGNRRHSRACISGQIDRRQDVRGRLRAGDDHRVDGALTQTTLRLGDRAEGLRDPRRPLRELRRMEADVELRDVEPEQLDAAAQVGEAAVGDAPAFVRAQAPVDDVQVGLELLCPPVAVIAEPPPDEGELAAVRLVAVLLADLLRVGRELALVARDRLEELVGDRDERRRQPERGGQLADLRAIARERQRPAAGERLAHGLRARVRVPVHVAADPGAEGERERRTGNRLAVRRDEILGRLQEGLLEEPQAVADLVHDARPLWSHLVRLPEHGDLLGGALLDALARVQVGEQRSEPGLRAEDRPARRLGGMGRDDELERDVSSGSGERLVFDAGLTEAGEGVGERLARRPVPTGDVAATPDPVVLLGDVRELEVEREGAEDLRLLVEIQRRDRLRQLGPDVGVAGLACPAGDVADLLLARQQLHSLLLDHDAAEQVAEEADVPSERRVGGHDLTDYGP